MGVFELPEGYAPIRRIDLQKDKKLAVKVNGIALAVCLLPTLIGVATIRIPFFADTDREPLRMALIMLIGMIAYLFSHELVHGIGIKRYSGKKAKYGFTGMYAYAGSDAYFDKHQYRLIAFAPVVVFAVIFLALNLLLPQRWFWIFYFLQVMNFGGAAGDLFVAFLLRKMPADVMVQDEGTAMTFFSQAGHE